MRTIILCTWKQSNKIEAYTTLTDFLKDHPAWSYNTISNYLSREQKPFQDEKITLQRLELKQAKKSRSKKARKTESRETKVKKLLNELGVKV